MAARKTLFSRRIGRFTWDRGALLLLIAAALFIAARSWLAEHPQHDPWAPLDLRHPVGWATAMKLRELKGNPPACRAVLARSAIPHSVLSAAGEGTCRREDRTRLDAFPLRPSPPPTTCAVALALELWQRKSLDPAARDVFSQRIARIEHLGAYSCRRLYGRAAGAWSEHATGNAIDIAAIVLEDGTRISVLNDWTSDDPKKTLFLGRIRDGACRVFSTTLSPDYNTAHRDHFHLDMATRYGGVCR